MKKFLLIFLIAIVACDFTKAQFEEKFKDAAKKVIGETMVVASNVKDFLKKNELWDPLTKVVKKEGKKIAEKLCSKFADQKTCDSLLVNVDAKGEVVLKIIPALIGIAGMIAWDCYKHYAGW